MKVLKAIGIGLLLEAGFIGIFVLAAMVEGTKWAALFGLAALPLLLIRFPEKNKGRRR